jgi:hypothetical protein
LLLLVWIISQIQTLQRLSHLLPVKLQLFQTRLWPIPEQFGVDRGKNFRQEFGGYIKIAFQKDIMTNVNFSTKIDLFSNYLKNPQNIDINWELLLSMKVNKYISATLSTQLIYDDDINYNNKGPKTQFKEIIGIGFSYKF